MSPDSALQDYAITRDPDSFRVIVQRYESFVYAVCRRMLTSADAEDAVQDVFFKLMRHADQIQDDATGWLHRCAVNTCRDTLRRNQTRRRRESNLQTTDRDADESPSGQLLAEVDEALLELQDEERSLLTRYYLDGETQQSIATDLLVNQSTIQRRIDAALERLRNVISKRGIVAAAAGIAAAMATSSTQAAVPPSVSSGLSKMALAAPPLATASTKSAILFNAGPWAAKVAAAVVAVLAVGGSAAVISSYFDAPDEAVITISEQPAQAYYRQEFDMTDSPVLSSLIQNVRDASRQAGHSMVGPPTFLHPEGLGTAPETSLIVAIPVSAAGANSDAVVTQSARTMISLKARPGENPYDVISRLEVAAAESGYQRTFQDRFVNLDANDEAGFEFEVQLGIRRLD